MSSEPLAPPSKALPDYTPSSPQAMVSPLRRWSSEAQEWVPVEIAQTPVQQARLERRRREELLARYAPQPVEAVVDAEPEDASKPEEPVEHLRRDVPRGPGGPWWRFWRAED